MKDAKWIVTRAEELLLARHHASWKQADAHQLHDAIAGAALEALTPVWTRRQAERAGKRQAYYFSAEFLIGRMVYNNLFNMGCLEEVRMLLAERGVDLAVLEEIEDASLGNGGLGRLAACFIDSAATHSIPLTGYGLRYRYGLFRQQIRDGRQVEEPDDWTRWGDPWFQRRDREAVVVPMATGDVRAVPYDMPVVGYGAENVGTLRLWQCESIHGINMRLFNEQRYLEASAEKTCAEDITKFVYPNDSKREGKQLRVKQQYVLVSASLQDLLRRYKARHGDDWRFFAEEHAIQLNDTHPVMAIPELIRLLQWEGMDFEEAFGIAFRTFSYTNHTVMQEALEKWDLDLLESVCPEIAALIRRIDERFRAEAEPTPQRCIVEGGRAHMAELAVYATHATNGVAELHSEILKKKLFADWYALYPERFQNKTNGITQRRWLGLCNPELTAMLRRELGEDGFLTELDRLQALKPKITPALCREFTEIKRIKKEQLSAAVERAMGVRIAPDWLFDVQIKRLHEYKRQLMNALSALALYVQLKDGSLTDFAPTVFLFGAKAAAGYVRAKSVIYLIHQIAELVNRDPEVNGRLQVVFVPNYNCSWAEKIIPAADLSEQISPAGTEASGTGNMKLMLNGAVTLGTFDGANIEIVEAAGRENNYIFGATAEELDAIRADYDPREIYRSDALLAKVLDMLVDGTFPDPEGGLQELFGSLLAGASWHRPDHYFILKDFRPYLEAKLRANRDWAHGPEAFARKCLYNIASAGRFSSDRTVREYARDIWGLEE
ncbi:MAG: glycogen/starch/alpha-glucan family phosphorylase [Clostridia bacterium]|nr:glycogen/starch/alpha-glucan family phosphorylase [Clostridia bacterium]